MTSLSDYMQLVSAVELDDVETMRSLLATGVSINANLDNDIGGILHVAARYNSIRCLDLVLSSPGDGSGNDFKIPAVVDFEMLATDRQQTALMVAAEHGHVNVLRRLVETGCDVNRQTMECSSALIIACHYGNVACVDALLENGADPRLMNPWMFNALYMSTDTPEILDRLLASSGRDDVNTACGERREVPLHLAAVIGSTHATRSLLSAGANINVRTIYDENALWLATWRGHPAVASILIQHNIELDVPSNGYQVYRCHYLPIEVAAGLQHYNIVRMLIMAGCLLKNRALDVQNNTGDDVEATVGNPTSVPPWIHLHPESLYFVRSDQELFAWFVRYVRNPTSLLDTCRRTIRRHLGTPLPMKIDRLGHLPRLIKECLMMGDIAHLYEIKL